MKCPHCLNLFHEQMEEGYVGEGAEGTWKRKFQVCPGCGRSIIFLGVYNVHGIRTSSSLVFPKGVARMPLSDDVDDLQVRSDYSEAALVLHDSPKASAALSRRCLQHILLEKANAKKGDLSTQIQELLDSNVLPSDIADNLDAIRNIGNFAAHPMKSTSSGEIVDVEPQEAEWNLEVLEQLIDYYYIRPSVSKKKREELNKKLADAGKPPLK